MATLFWVIVVGVLAGGGWWLAYRNSARRRFPTGGLRADYDYCLRAFQLDRFEADNILAPVVLLDEYRIAGQRFKKTDVIVDVGAHVGVFAFLCHRKGSRAIHAYEPSARNFALLQKHVGVLDGVHCVSAAVWRSDREDSPSLRLSRLDHENTGANSVLAGGEAIDFPEQQTLAAGAPVDDVPVIALDRILERFARVKLLKLDCEGSEFPILLTSRCLGRVERIVGELHECGEDMMRRLIPESRVEGHDTFRAQDLVARLESFGFQVHLRPASGHMWLFDARRAAR
jgi:FkbM family methyltransferase